MVEFPTLATQKKIKGLQMFRRKANIIQQGDRAGICVSNFDAKLMERGELEITLVNKLFSISAQAHNLTTVHRHHSISRNSQINPWRHCCGA
jgi:hypothetical protein